MSNAEVDVFFRFCNTYRILYEIKIVGVKSKFEHFGVPMCIVPRDKKTMRLRYSIEWFL
jgi:hypothetical protein